MKQYQLTPIQTNCPICNASEAQILWSIKSEQATRHYVVEEVDPQRFFKLAAHIEELWQQDTCDVVRCDSCGFCYSHPYVAGDDQFYTLAYDRSHYPTWKWEHQLTYDALRQSCRDFTLLEIGAGDGAFVKGVSPTLTSKENVLCTEFSDYGRSQIVNYGIECFPKDIRTAEFEEFKSHFDVICMFQVLEHLDRLDDLFQQLNYLTRGQASLFISVPNPKCIEFSELNGGLLDMPPNHIGRWNKHCFEEICKRWNWQLYQYEIEQTDLLSKALLFWKYRFWREGQQPGSFANQVSRIKNPYLTKLMWLIGVGHYALSDLSKLNALRAKELGLSQWIHLKRS